MSESMSDWRLNLFRSTRTTTKLFQEFNLRTYTDLQVATANLNRKCHYKFQKLSSITEKGRCEMYSIDSCKSSDSGLLTIHLEIILLQMGLRLLGSIVILSTLTLTVVRSSTTSKTVATTSKTVTTTSTTVETTSKTVLTTSKQ